MTNAERYRAILSHHLPAQAVDWVYAFLDRHRVHFHVSRGRRSKLGDYRRPYPGHQYHEMSVNGDLNPNLFLLVFVHEAAHLLTHLQSPLAQPHGHEWQSTYAALLRSCAHMFPPEVQPMLATYTSRLPLSTALGRRIEAALRHYGEAAPPATTLDDLEPGTLFRLKDKPSMLMRAEQRRRTRWLCTDMGSGRPYSVAGAAEVVPQS